jgi:hypothetical protein
MMLWTACGSLVIVSVPSQDNLLSFGLILTIYTRN